MDELAATKKTGLLFKQENPLVEERSEMRTAKHIIFSHEEAFQEALKYFKGDELAAKVWVNKYALKDSFGKLHEKSPDQMHRRIGKEISRIEKKYPNPIPEEELYNLLSDFRYIVPQGSPMTGIGNHFQIASLSNCFVIGHNGASDPYGGIMKIDQEQVQCGDGGPHEGDIGKTGISGVGE